MRKLSTATTNGIEKLQRLTIGLDLGDLTRRSALHSAFFFLSRPPGLARSK